ncbi:hypothetical protein GmHk_10G027795 [Glycine max]|nr:hypothetical protein GmHk_10G027795 [Glycine max]
MSSVCLSKCVNDARDPRVPVRATYVNLYKWPESDAEFVRRRGGGSHMCGGHPRVVDSISCRQMYLRSYKFSRKESVPEKTQKCFGRVKERVKKQGRSHHGIRRRKCLNFSQEICCKVAMAIWCIWRRRNDKVWNNEEPVPSISILFRMVSGKELLEEGGSCYTSNLQPTTWKKPPKGKIKSNIDAAIFKQQQIFGAGICIREGHGRFLKAKTTW